MGSGGIWRDVGCGEVMGFIDSVRSIRGRQAAARPKRGAPAEYAEEARQRRLEEQRCLMLEIKHDFARSDMGGPRRPAVLAEIWSELRHSLSLVGWCFTLDISDALEDWPDDVTLRALDIFVEAGWLQRRTPHGEPTFRSHVKLAPKYAAEVRRNFDVTGERGLVIREM